MNPTGDTARLKINGTNVGHVRVNSFADSWGFGEFTPNAAFGQFAVIFGQWSLLMHANYDESRLPEAASDELRRAELAMDALRCELIFEDRAEAMDLSQVNIDGTLIEWKLDQRRRIKRAV